MRTGFGGHFGSRRGGLILTMVVFGASVAFASYASASVVVTSLFSDADNAGDGICTLREAVKAENAFTNYHECVYSQAADSTQDYITLPCNGTLTLTSTLPQITAQTTVIGCGYNSTIIDGGNTSAVGKWVMNSEFALLRDLALQNFKSGVLDIADAGSAGISFVKISKSGGGTSGTECVHIVGDFDVSDSQFDSCSGYQGAALHSDTGGLFMSRTTVIKSNAEHGIINTYNSGGLTIIDASTISSNIGGLDGAIVNSGGTVQISNSTLAYNVAGLGGSATTLINVSGTLEINASVVYGYDNWQPPALRDCYGTITSNGYNEYRNEAVAACSAGGVGDFLVTPNDTKTDRGLLLGALTASETGAGGHVYVNLPGTAPGAVGRAYLPATNYPGLGIVGSQFCLNDQRGVRKNASSKCDVGAVQRAPALFVVGNTTLSTGDNFMLSVLNSAGYSVTVVKDSVATASSAQNKSLVLISQSVNPNNVTTKFRDVSAGVIVMQPALFDDMRMTTTANLGTVNANTGTLVRGTSIPSFTGNTIASGSWTNAAAYAWGRGGTTYVKATSDSTKSLVFGYGPGEIMIGSFAAPAARVGFFMPSTVSPNTQGTQLFLASAFLASDF